MQNVGQLGVRLVAYGGNVADIAKPIPNTSSSSPMRSSGRRSMH
jgi:hypothetical protein